MTRPSARTAIGYACVATVAALLAVAMFAAVRPVRNEPGSTGAGPVVAAPTEASVDAGFARDMTVHHEQAVQMASYTRDHVTSTQLRLLAVGIETEQQFEVGQMRGWLDGWGLQYTSNLRAMSWMEMHEGHHGTTGSTGGVVGAVDMPGLATPAEMDELVNLTGVRLEIRFLQLMIRHHQGGLTMAQYAATHAQTDYVRRLAMQMVTAQTAEVDTMQAMLTERKASPLPPP